MAGTPSAELLLSGCAAMVASSARSSPSMSALDVFKHDSLIYLTGNNASRWSSWKRRWKRPLRLARDAAT